MILQFDPFESKVDISFWEILAKKKMEVWKLDASSQYIFASYEKGRILESNSAAIAHNITASFPDPKLASSVESEPGAEAVVAAHRVPCLMSVNFQAFGPLTSSIPLAAMSNNSSFQFKCGATLENTNTLDEFKNLDKNLCLKNWSSKIWAAILDGSALKNPSILTKFGLITYADLKKYKFYYWFAFPALLPREPFEFNEMRLLTDIFSTKMQQNEFKEKTGAFQDSFPDQAAFFLVKTGSDGTVQVGALSEWATFWTEPPYTVAFADPSSRQSNPGWPLRNFLILLQKTFNPSQVNIIAQRFNFEKSLYFTVKFDSSRLLSDNIPSFVGWENGISGAPTPRIANLGPMMDPKRLADSAVDLNLKLMRWRILPTLNLESISSTKCLLLGAGTLGCYVARMLMAWGVRHITFVDNGKVSFSNPVRQPLYSFSDCLQGGAPKAQAAAKALESVFPGVTAIGVDMSIPMPGHATDSDLKIINRIEKLTDLIDSHDAVFLLTDSRESRWLPTVLGAASKKIVINTALGFDSFLVLRHGMQDSDPKLGCYFCNDVVAPVDSLTHRTLDQQCTVTRPGLSGIASGVAVELLAAILQHPLKAGAPAESAESTVLSPLGIVPHQIRGSLGNFTNLILKGSAYEKCTACSDAIQMRLRKDATEFLVKALKDPAYLEEVAGLTKMKLEMDKHDDYEWDDDE